MLTDNHLEKERPSDIGGVQRLYKFPSGYGLSLINTPMAHAYKYAWEAAVLAPSGAIDYGTKLTGDVEVFFTDEEANAFIEKAYKTIGKV